jgi:hypothetical protein
MKEMSHDLGVRYRHDDRGIDHHSAAVIASAYAAGNAR